jgi:phosphoribosyl-AMP cyclohydrolase
MSFVDTMSFVALRPTEDSQRRWWWRRRRRRRRHATPSDSGVIQGLGKMLLQCDNAVVIVGPPIMSIW